MSNSSGTTTVTVGGETFEITITKVTNNNNSNKNNNPYANKGIKFAEENDNESTQEGGKAKKGKKAKKGTRKLSKYMIFCQKERDKLLKERPELKSDIPGIGRALGERWRALSDSEKASL